MTPEVVIKAGHNSTRYWRDLWAYRELFLFLAWRDLLVRYKQTVAGVAWAVLRPLLSIGILMFVFGKVAKLPSEGAPYSVMVLTALLPWQFLSSGMTESGNSLLSNSNLVTKVYFPRMVVPASAIMTALIDFAISGVLLGFLMLWHQSFPTWRCVFLPAYILLAVMAAAGAGLWISALTVQFRDMRFVVPFLVQCGFFVSPIGYSSSVIPADWRLLYAVNPVAGIIDGFRWCLLSPGTPLYLHGLLLCTGATLLLLITGFWCFRSVERKLADII